ncbi:MAG: tetratricopeptide repeat protein [Blastocatellia bacterium]|nr:tetratricopeptide repeat protein [Blastocatellia bacterium]
MRQIDDIFTMAGVTRGKIPPDRVISGHRRTRVEEYYASLNWRRESDARKFLTVLGYALALLYSSNEAGDRLRMLCEGEGLTVDGILVCSNTDEFGNYARHYDVKIAEYTKDIERDPNDADAYHNRGGYYMAKADRERAIADFTKAIELKPNDVASYLSRGLVYAPDDRDRAFADFAKAIEICPDYAHAYFCRGMYYDYYGDKDRAVADFRKSYELFTIPYEREMALRELRRLGYSMGDL